MGLDDHRDVVPEFADLSYAERAVVVEAIALAVAHLVADHAAPDALNRIVHAFVEPILRSHMSDTGKSYAQLVVRAASDPRYETHGIIGDYVDPVAKEFVAALQKALPAESLDYIRWA